MRDIYTESVVPVPSKPIYKVAKFILMALTALSVFAVGFAGLIFVLFAAVFGFLLYRVMQKDGGEYEYVHTNNSFDVDLVISNSRRKHLLTVDLDQVALVAKADSSEMDGYSHLPETDYSGDAQTDTLYAMVYTDTGKRKRLLLKIESNMYRSLKQWMPEKVK